MSPALSHHLSVGHFSVLLDICSSPHLSFLLIPGSPYTQGRPSNPLSIILAGEHWGLGECCWQGSQHVQRSWGGEERVLGFKEPQGGSGSCSTVRWAGAGVGFPYHPILCRCHSPGLSWPFWEHCKAPCWASTSTPAWCVCSHSHQKDPVNNHVSSRSSCAQHHPWLPSHWEKRQSPHLAHRPCRAWPHSPLPSLTLLQPRWPPCYLNPPNVLSPHSFCVCWSLFPELG